MFVKFERPQILYMLLVSHPWNEVLHSDFKEKVKQNANSVIESNYGSDQPGDLKSVSLPFKQIFNSEDGDTAYLIEYEGMEVLIRDKEGKEKFTSPFPDHLFEI